VADRYIIRELQGYTIEPSSHSPSSSKVPPTDVYIFDTWYGFQLVQAFKGNPPNGRPWLDERRRMAAERCAELNAESEAANLRSMQAATVGEDAQAREGTAI
jgi:hypothetical protein